MKTFLLLSTASLLLTLWLPRTTYTLAVDGPVHPAASLVDGTKPRDPAAVREVYLTAYSSIDSCHYPKGDGCLTASGWIAGDKTIACPRNWKLGTQVEIYGEIYVCQDRYSLKLDQIRDLPTVDMWAGYGRAAHEVAVSFGIRKANVTIR